MHEDGFVRKALPNRLCKVLYNKECFVKCLKILVLLSFLFSLYSQAKEESKGIGFATVAEALTSLTSKRETKLSVQGG
jgi:hypothetical protein